MGIKVDRYLKQLPDRFFDDRGNLTEEGEEWYEYDNRWKQAVWSKLGGTDDFITEVQNGELYEPGIETSNASELIEELEVGAEAQPIGSIISELEVIPTATSFTTTGSQVIICTNTTPITITLNSTPDQVESVNIVRQGAGAITISGSVNGASSINILSRYDSPHLIFTIEAGEWSII